MPRFFVFTLMIIVVLALNLFDSSTARHVFECPSEDIATGCKDPKECIYADSNNCNGFIQCNDAGEVFHKKCNFGLEWNDLIKNCDEPRHSTCIRFY